MKKDFPGGPVVKTSPSSAGGMGLIPGSEDLRSGCKTKIQNRNNIITNSIKSSNTVHIKKKKIFGKKLKRKRNFKQLPLLRSRLIVHAF